MSSVSPQVTVLEAESVPVSLPRPTLLHRWTAYPLTAPHDVEARLQGAEVAIINKVRLDAALLARLPDLRMIALLATGTDNIDLAACRERGIVVSNVRNYAADTVTEHALLLMLALRRNLLAYVADVRDGAWVRSPLFGLFNHPVNDLFGSTLAIVGRGSLGEGLAQRAQALGMQVIYAERRGAAVVRTGYVAFETALREADVVSLHCPLTEATRGLIGAPELALMKPSAILINTARGGLVVEQALADALRAGQIAGVATDVLSQEPPSADNLLLAADIPNLIVTPHMAWATQQGAQRLVNAAMANVDAYLAGAPTSRVA